MTPPSTTTTSPPSTTTFHHSIRPWLTDFFATSTLSLPLSFTELAFRIQKNLHTFHANYLIITALIFLSSLVIFHHPILFIFSILIISTSIYVGLVRDEPFLVFGFEIRQRRVRGVVYMVTFVVLVVNDVWWNVFTSGLVSAVVVCLHAVFKTPDHDDADDVESPKYGELLSVIDDNEGDSGILLARDLIRSSDHV
uniref:PRA1 family protein F2-like n=1 Tax=Erigeron canadensis TaxID=72917 RepID=UPI001CB9760C|nr:PRA1 family protein F2-like [Erigeron canadensis]